MPDELEGWHLDPFGRHGERYFYGGHPTALARDGDQEVQDNLPNGAAPSPSAGLDARKPPSSSIAAPPGFSVEFDEVQKTSGMAIASLVLGLVPVVPFVGSILAIVFGKVAKDRISESRGRVKGAGMAAWGLALGIISLIGYAIIFVVIVVSDVNASNSESSASSYNFGYQHGVAGAQQNQSLGTLQYTGASAYCWGPQQWAAGYDANQARTGCTDGYDSIG